MYNSLYYIFNKDYNYNEYYTNDYLYLKDKNNKLKILNDSKDRELKYFKKKYDTLVNRYNDIEWKYNELLLNTHYNKEYYKNLEIKYNNSMKKYNLCFDNMGDIQCININDDYEHI
jgi:hypothetical protein